MISEHDFEENNPVLNEECDVLFLLRTGKIVKCTLSPIQYKNLIENNNQLFSGPVINGTWSEFASFDGSQIKKWKKA